MKNPSQALKQRQTESLKAVPSSGNAFTFSSPYLRILMAGKSRETKVYSLKNLKSIVKQFVRPLQSRVAEDMELSDSKWYHHYE